MKNGRRRTDTWYLKTYDINESGQVHTYIGYLADLPYEEQLYWQSFNEWPKGPISRRAHTTDILGDWHLEYDPLESLKQTISRLDKDPPPWWKARGEELQSAVRYPATDSVKEWADEVLALDQYLVEGFLVKPLRELAKQGGLAIDVKWASLRILQELLVMHGRSEESSKEVLSPIQRLHALRTEVKGHAAPGKKQAAESAAREKFGSLRAHFQELVGQCEKSLLEIVGALGARLDG